MKILFLSELFHPHGGGAELATYLYANLLSKEGFDVVVVTNKFAGDAEGSKDGNLTIYRLPLFKGMRGVKYSILKRVDVLLSSFIRKMVKWADAIYVPRFWFSAIPLAKAYGKPVVTHLHDYIPICPLSNFYEALRGKVCSGHMLFCPSSCIYVNEKRLGRASFETLAAVFLNSSLGRCLGKLTEFSDAIICVSKTQRDIILSQEPTLREKTHVVYNPVPENTYAKIEGDDFGYFGGDNYLKGFSVLYKAMMHLKQTGAGRIRIHATKFSFPSCKGQFANSLGQLGFIAHGRLGRGEYEKVYRQVRAVVVPSIWHEPWPYVVVEALVQGRFVIASRIGGIPEQVESCNGVVLCDAGNHIELADAIGSVSGLEREYMIDLGLHNRETFLNRFNNNDTIRKFVSVFERLN